MLGAWVSCCLFVTIVVGIGLSRHCCWVSGVLIFFKALEKKFEIPSWVGFANVFKNFGLCADLCGF